MEPNIAARWEMDLSPGTSTCPESPALASRIVSLPDALVTLT
jgi:hypothetical protein